MAHNSINEQSIDTAWTPDLFGPIFKKESLTLKKVLDLRNIDEQMHLMATFVPDELIYETDLLEKSFHRFQAILMYLNIPDFLSLFKKYFYDKNGGSLDLTAMLNNYIHIVVNQIYCSDGDLLKFSADGILAMWKVHDGEFMFNVVQKVIIRAMDIQNYIAALKKNDKTFKANSRQWIAISAGDVTFSTIGNEEARHFVIYGSPIEELKHAKKISMPGDLILSLSAWQHCTPSQYEYVIKDAYNVKILKLLKQSDAKLMTPISLNDSIDNRVHINSGHETFIDRKFLTNSIKPSTFYRNIRVLSINNKTYSEIIIAKKVKKEVPTAISTIAAMNPNFGTLLKNYLIKPVVQQIEKNESLKYLANVRRITVMFLDIIPSKCSENELILLTDKCFLLLHSIVTQYAGCINMVNLYDRNIFFCVIFGIRESNNEDQFKIDETCKNGIICAMHVLQAVKNVVGILSVFVGVSTGMAYCSVIGHVARKHYAIIGPPVNKAIKLMDISYNKISCDYDTVLHSHLNKNHFRSRGMRTWNRLEKYHIYEYLGDMPIRKNLDATLSLDYCYPILGRMQELECFNDILDEIGVANRHYSGLLIKGRERIGKSRLLDAFVTSVCNRQIKPIKLSLHVTYADKAYAVIYHIILQLFQADDSDTVEDRQKALLLKLGDVLALEDFCYLNTLLRVRFPLSQTYCSDSESQRHMKTINIFKTILKQLKTKICILLDDVQHIDYISWQFLSSALDNDNVVVVMTMLKIHSEEGLSQAEMDIYKDSRIKQHILLGLNVDLLPALTCQFLNVLAIPRILSRLLQKRKDGYIGWCELYLTLLLQNNNLNFITISPNEAKRHDLIFPDASLVTKLPIDLTPEELAPPFSWSQMSHLDVCVMHGNYSKMFDTSRNLKELVKEIYDGMNPYQQSLITCAATLGKVFKRNALQNVMLNEIPPHTTNAISQMFRIRILECAALQRRDFRTDILIFCIDKKRSTFSDMHHLQSCHCDLSQQSAGQCKMLEFKFTLFCDIIYDMQSSEERKEHHARAVRIYSRDAQKCNCCDGGRFLRIPSKDIIAKKESPVELPQMSLIRRRTNFIGDENDKSSRRQNVFFARRIAAAKKEEPINITRRVSIMPTHLDKIKDKVSRNQESKESLTSKPLNFRKRQTSIAPKVKEPSHSGYLEKFSHIDYRDCQCDSIISYLFWKLHKHIEERGNTDEVINFLLEYSAGLIQTAQSLYAVKLLLIAAEKNEAVETSAQIDARAKNNITNEGIILALTGDAYSELGNYAEAKKCYIEAMKLRGTPPKMNKAACYNIMLKMYYISQNLPRYNVPRQLAVKNMEFASYMRRVCIMYMVENKLKIAQLFAFRSFKLAFLYFDSFLEKGEIYLVTVRVLHRTKNITLIRRVESSMLTVINKKLKWNDVEELVMVANIYLTMYQIRALRGELEEAVDMGMKVLKICGAFHHDKVTLNIMPSLIQIMLWTKRINAAVDLMRELYFLAEDDVDLSSKTWYYALSLEFILDAGIVLASYQTSYNYYINIVHKSKSCVWRDPESLCRLSICLGIYQLRMGHTVTVDASEHKTKEYTEDISWDHFSRIFSCSKIFEYYLLILLRRINIKHSNQLLDLIEDIYKVIKCLKNISNTTMVVKPHFYLLMAYLNVLRGRKSTTQHYLHEAQKFAISQGNKLIMAWIMQNRRTWKKKIYNNMARYWLEYIESADIVAWQNICDFNIDIWSTILYPLPTPDSYL